MITVTERDGIITVDLGLDHLSRPMRARFIWDGDSLSLVYRTGLRTESLSESFATVRFNGFQDNDTRSRIMREGGYS